MKSENRWIWVDTVMLLVPMGLALVTLHLFWVLFTLGYCIGVIVESLAEETR